MTPKRRAMAGKPRFGVYSRKFARGRSKYYKRSPAAYNSSPYLNGGFNVLTEVNGKVSDVDCVYVGHSSHTPTLVRELVMYAILRKLWKKASIDVTGVNEILFCTNQGATSLPPAYSSVGWRIKLNRYNPVAETYESYNYDTKTGETIKIICGDQANGVAPQWTDFANVVAGVMTGSFSTYNAGNSLNITEMVNIQLYSLISGTNYVLVGDLDLKDERVHFKTNSLLKVQNRSKAEGGGVEATDVANNPLVGYLYHFRHATPDSNMENADELTYSEGLTGAMTVRGVDAGDLDYNEMLKEPPSPKFFNNCSFAKRVTLSPGRVIFDRVSYVTSAPIYGFLSEAGGGTDNSGNGRFRRLKGTCGMFALEDMINVNAEENIVVAYEINRNTMCYLSTHRPQISYGKFTKLVQNNPIA